MGTMPLVLLRLYVLLAFVPAIVVAMKPNMVPGQPDCTKKGQPRRSWVEVSGSRWAPAYPVEHDFGAVGGIFIHVRVALECVLRTDVQ